MRRSIPVFIMLLAQVINSMMPVCLVRCIGADGHERVELLGLDCGCDQTHPEQEVAVTESEHESRCCAHHHPAAPKTDEPRPLVSSTNCGCQHSMMEAADQVVARSTIQHSIECLSFAVLAACSTSVCTDPAAVSGLRHCPSRPHISPHLRMLATTVLRV